MLTNSKAKLEGIQNKAKRVVERIQTFSIDRFKQLYNADQPKSLILEPLFDSYIYTLKSKKKLSSAESYTSAKMALHRFSNEFYNKEILELLDIDVRWLDELEAWWLNQGKSITTIGIYLRNLRCIFNRAIDDGIISRQYYPFGVKKYEIPEKNIKRALYEDQINKLKSYKPKTEGEQKAYDLFMFSYFSFGMNMKDIALLKYRQINEDSITFIREKTKSTKRKSIINIYVTINPLM